MTTMTELFGEPIHCYTREAALSDGVLVAANGDLARDAGLLWPVAYTSAVFDDCIRWSEDAGGCQDETGREWDVLFMLAATLRHAKRTGRQSVTLARVRPGQSEPVETTLTVTVGPGDAGEPVLTVMFPHED